MALFSAYFDESGTHGSPLLTLACYVATVEQWKHFEREWKGVLQQENLTHFHMSKFEARRGEFTEERGWTNERRVRVLKQFIGIIKRRVNMGFFTTLNLAAYEELVTDWRRDQLGTPYNFCVKTCFSQISLWAQEFKRTEPIAYVIEHGAGYDKEIRKAFTATFEDEGLRRVFRLGSLTFIDKYSAVQLQAADLLAYEAWKAAYNAHISDKKRPRRKSFASLIEAPHRGAYYGRESFQKMLEMQQSDYEIHYPELIVKYTAKREPE